jgi:hypothetical protein
LTLSKTHCAKLGILYEENNTEANMQIISDQKQLNALPPTPLHDHLADKYDDLVETEDDIPPIFIIVEEGDDITGPNYAFVTDNGLLGDDDLPYESITHLPDIDAHELLLLLNGENAYWIYVPDAAVESNPALARLLNTPTAL